MFFFGNTVHIFHVFDKYKTRTKFSDIKLLWFPNKSWSNIASKVGCAVHFIYCDGYVFVKPDNNTEGKEKNTIIYHAICGYFGSDD